MCFKGLKKYEKPGATPFLAFLSLFNHHLWYYEKRQFFYLYLKSNLLPNLVKNDLTRTKAQILCKAYCSTYFVPEEGFLAGLALNNENVTFSENYKKILRFYGFDLDNDQIPTLPPQPNNETSSNETTATSTVIGDVSTEMPTTQAPMPIETQSGREDATTSAMREETTINPNAETINDIDIRGQTTTVNPSSAPNAESTTNSPPSSEQFATEQDTTVQTTTVSTTVISPTTEKPTTSAGTVTESVTPVMTTMPTEDPRANNEVVTTAVSTMASEATSADTTLTMTTNDDTSTLAPSNPTTEQSSTTLSEMMTTLLDATTPANETTLETLQRKKKSIVDFIFTNPPYIDDYLVYRSYDIGLEPQNIYGEKMFLVNGLRNMQVTYMHYDTVLEHAYLPHLEASTIRLPLDSERYYLLVVLPSRRGIGELNRLLSRMARESDLRDVYAALHPRRVRAIVPSFVVKGHVALTTDLQKLGIRDVFEPRQRDFTPMTSQPGVYVRSIEQAVSVAIRKYRPDDHKKNRYVTSHDPVYFSATYPFLYFVMDASIHVALMAGKMVDPLNTRIL